MDASQDKNEVLLNKNFKSDVPWYFQPKTQRLDSRTCPAIKNAISDFLTKNPDMNESEAINFLLAKGLGLKMNLYS